jgi:uncharacterized protein (TIGR04255 family)
MHSYSESRVARDSINIISRVIIQNSELVFPPDLEPLGLMILARFQTKGLHAVLDTDGFIEKKEAFEMRQVASQLKDIHLAIIDCFKKLDTPHAFKVWDE